jgi:hypothetical protein
MIISLIIGIIIYLSTKSDDITAEDIISQADIDNYMKSNSKPETIPDIKPETTQDIKPEATQDIKPDIKPSVSVDSKKTKQDKMIEEKGLTEIMQKSSILDLDKALKLAEWVKFEKPVLLYLGSRDGFSSEKFHKLCDNKSKILVIYKLKDSTIIGGYTTVGFKSKGGLVEDSTAFIFNLTTKTKFNVINSSNAVFDVDNYGPSFGNGDITITLNDKTGIGSTNGKKKTYDENGDGVLGTKNIDVLNIEVWQVSTLTTSCVGKWVDNEM